jgi:hypothetical protein
MNTDETHLFDSLLGRLFQRLAVEMLRHCDYVCEQQRARRQLDILAYADELERQGAKAIADNLRAKVWAEDTLRLPALEAEVAQLLLPVTHEPAAGAAAGRPLSTPARAKKRQRPVRTPAVSNGRDSGHTPERRDS